MGRFFQLYFFDLKLIHSLELVVHTHSHAEEDQPIMGQPHYDFNYASDQNVGGSERTFDSAAVLRSINDV
jgi:hypothetical protein